MALRGRGMRVRYSIGLVLVACASLLSAATYLPVSDAELARRSPVIVRAQALSQQVRHAPLPGTGADRLLTTTTLRVLEVIRGAELSSGDTLDLTLPGGIDGTVAYWIAGTPRFVPGGEFVLLLAPRADGGFSLTEFGLSKFDLLTDAVGRAFAVRPVFSDEEDDLASRRTTTIARSLSGATRPRQLRDAGSFLAMLRATAAGAAAVPVLYATPSGPLAAASASGTTRGKSPLWVNIGGVEGSGAQFRWYWDSGLSPSALVSASGVQTGLSDGSNGLSAVQNGATQWSAVADTDVRYSTTSGSGPVVVHLDVESESGAWTDSLPCTSGGIIGYGGPGPSRSAPSFKGDSNFYAPSSGDVWMRKVTGGCYSASLFKSAVLHELGHTLGLGHPDEATSIHSTTTAADWSAAVMHSVLPANHPAAPQTDDIQAIQYYYGNGGTITPPPPVAAFSYTPINPVAGVSVSFLDASTGAPTSWVWSFGDGQASLVENPAHVFAAAGSYIVTLTAANAGGNNFASRTIVVAPGGAGTAPSAAFSFSPAAPAPGSTVQFTDSSTAAPSSWTWNFGDGLSGGASSSTLPNPTHVFAAAGTYTVSLKVSNAFGSATTSHLVTVAGCGSGSLCLNGGRFRVTASWSVPTQGTNGAGIPVALTGDTGYFWFFTPNNVELVVKVVDGRAVNDHFWFFSGALSDVEYTILVTDTVTGAQRAYFNPQGTLESLADTSAFPPAADPAAASKALPAVPTIADEARNEVAVAAAPCSVTTSTLCLNSSRFRVQVSWNVPAQETSGSGVAVPLTVDTGYFWFFSANNVELTIKVVDGRVVNGHFWVFFGALSDVGYTITVTDTATGATRSYTNPPGALSSFADVSAF